ncbi:MAG: hypothetical protein II767_04110 [Proteobacteria bacterium]|nr:hypothetical protein [Pseudomonadota bacterium]MBQ4359418.1 hypothetical protein [Pseudomonadota bacterium]
MRTIKCIVLASLCILGTASAAYAGDKCNTNSDCKDGAKCISNVCANTSGGKCYNDSDCGKAKCISNKCANAADGKCYNSSDCGGGSCSSNKCSNAR